MARSKKKTRNELNRGSGIFSITVLLLFWLPVTTEFHGFDLGLIIDPVLPYFHCSLGFSLHTLSSTTSITLSKWRKIASIG